MFSTIAVVVSLIVAPGDAHDFQLALKKDQKVTYQVGMKSQERKSEGRLELTVTAEDETGLTVSWPEIKYSAGMSPHAAGSYRISRRGRLIGKEKMPDACMYLLQMTLPDKPVSLGESFKVAYAWGDSSMDLTGKLEKLDESKDKLAHFTFEGTLRTPAGGAIQVKQRSVFDMARGAFRSCELEMPQFGMTFFLSLPEG